MAKSRLPNFLDLDKPSGQSTYYASAMPSVPCCDVRITELRLNVTAGGTVADGCQLRVTPKDNRHPHSFLYLVYR